MTTVVALHTDLAFEAFYSSQRASVARALALTLHDSDLAADAADEAMARAFARWRTVQRLQNPSGWVYRVGLNWARSVLRRRNGPRRRVHDIDEQIIEVRDQQLHRALLRLDLDRRAVVVCRYFLGMTEDEIAQSLDIRPGTVKSRLHRALRHLEDQLGYTREEEG
ncbi:MAG: sigma-70 family RNA polymerase sigma factor [Actinomycetota bacterium]|nr:sigma-70 family RNA polymerase sigma factor [Actinomycetota bacterium]